MVIGAVGLSHASHAPILLVQPHEADMTVFEKPEDLEGYLFRITDNGGASVDRYTVAFSDGSYLALSGSPTHPQGFSQHGEDLDPQVAEDWIEEGKALDLALGDLPEGLVAHILSRENEGLQDLLEAVGRRDPSAVAPSREAAKVNEGLSSSLGHGIYHTPEGYRVRLDGPSEDDRGPYGTAREVVLAALPDHYSLSGPEYHSRTDLMRMEPDEDVRASIAALEAKVEAGFPAGPRM